VEITGKQYRIGIVGASSLAGKELSDELGESSLATANVILLDDEEEAAGQITAAGDEVAFIQRIEAESFERMDFVFFAGAPEVTKRHWHEARRAGASIIDLTYALEQEKDVLVLSPWVTEAMGDRVRGAREPDLQTPAVVPAHPVVVMLGLVGARISSQVKLAGIAATVMEPASQHGRGAMDEMHQQTVSLLSFQSLPREQYDAQVSFNLLPSLGDSSKIGFASTERRIRHQYAELSSGILPRLTVQMVQAPVFHGYVVSVLVDLSEPATVTEIEHAVSGDHIDLVDAKSEPPTNLSAAGQEDIMVRVSGDFDGERGTRFWLWLAADNLKLAALNAIACAAELRRLRPTGQVQ
jgi:aspartate-semialdehyde dehydrogenase